MPKWHLSTPACEVPGHEETCASIEDDATGCCVVNCVPLCVAQEIVFAFNDFYNEEEA